MACGEARKLHDATGRKVAILKRNRLPQWASVWEGVPFLVPQPFSGAETIVNGPGLRPYIASKTLGRWTWQPYTPLPGAINFTRDETIFAAKWAGRVLVEPNTNSLTNHQNKQWGFGRWCSVVRAMPRERFVQCGPSDTKWINAPNVDRVVTETFRQACAVLAVSKAFIGNEGGLMHAAAAVGVRCVIPFGAFISPAVTGYAANRNLFTGTGLGCGNRLACDCCLKAMSRISVETVVSNLKEIL